MSMSISSTDDGPMHQMNTTPLIDVLLVLLIMFIHHPGADPCSEDGSAHGRRVRFRPRSGSEPHHHRPAWRHSLERRRRGSDDAAPLSRYGGTYGHRTRVGDHARPQARYAVVDAVLADIKGSGAKNLGFVGNESYARF
jgi:biopolymer transport protein ExbD